MDISKQELSCVECHKLFSSQGNLNKHIKNIHSSSFEPKGFAFNGSLFKCLEDCELSFKTGKMLRKHLSLKHNFQVAEEHFNFISFEEFSAWREQEERDNNIRFIKLNGKENNVDGNLGKIRYICSRSGKQRILALDSRQRNEKSRGSSKMNIGCTSQIIMTKNNITNECSAVYYSTHYGHDKELEHLRVSQFCRKEVASKLIMGVPPTKFLDSIRDNIQGPLNRDMIITRKDIIIIKNSFNLGINDGCRHEEDATSVDLWVKECIASDNNPIHFFKKQGEACFEFNLDINDFCLVFMNATQIEMFNKFGSNIVCIDGTHGMNAYDFELTTILVLDEYGEGFPVVFLFSNRKDTYIYEVFFSCIKKTIGTGNKLTCNIFMSDVTNVYYNAWIKTMGVVNKQLYCSWHIDRAWHQNLAKVKCSDKRKWVYKTLKHLQTCLDDKIFERDMQNFLNILISDEDTKNMYEYLVRNYFENRFQWAYCYRKGSGINTHMHLESMHKVVKYIYLEGKKIKRLDKSIHALLKYLRDKVIDRIIKLTKGKNNDHLMQIKSRHRAACIGSCEVKKIDNNTYEVSDRKNNLVHIVTKCKEGVCCVLVCNFCSICVHMYQCSCIDFLIKTNICKHIHSVGLLTNNNFTGINKTNKVEVDELVNNISQKSSFKNSSEIIQKYMSHMQNNLSTLHYTPQEHEHIIKNLKSLINFGSTTPVGQPLNNFVTKNVIPVNKKIEKQIFFSTKKKKILKTKKNSKPNSAEIKIIRETLANDPFISNSPQNDHLY